MKQVNGYEIKEFTYESKVRRNHHVAEMELEGWEESGQVKRLKEGANLLTATENDYEHYARFQRNTLSVKTTIKE